MIRPRAGGDEQDAFSRTRRIHSWGRGQLRWIKRKAGKRERRLAKTVIGQERDGER
jgi:hypothetical protein